MKKRSNHIQRRQKKKKAQKDAQGGFLKRYRGVFLRYLYYVGVVFFFGVAIYTLFYADFMRIRDVSVEGAVRVSQDELLNVINQKGGERNFLGMRKDHLLLFPFSQTRQEVIDQFAVLKNVEMDRIFPGGIVVQVEEYGEILVVCPSSELLKNDPYCAHVSEDGVVLFQDLLSSAHFSANSTVIVSVEKEYDAGIGDFLLKPTYYENILYTLRELPFRLGVQSVEVPVMPLVGSGHMSVQTDEGWRYIVDLSHEPRVSFAVAEAFFRQNEGADFRRQLVELDVRLLDKIFSKLEGQQGDVADSVDEVSLNENEGV